MYRFTQDEIDLDELRARQPQVPAQAAPDGGCDRASRNGISVAGISSIRGGASRRAEEPTQDRVLTQVSADRGVDGYQVTDGGAQRLIRLEEVGYAI
jgi:hypothetical protein